MSERRQTLLVKVLAWLRGGYPQGVPAHDYVALLGILHRSCTEEEIEIITRQMRDEGLVSDREPEEEIRIRLRGYLHETPSEEDVRRVAARLASGGWPLTQVVDGAEQAPTPPVPGTESPPADSPSPATPT